MIALMPTSIFEWVMMSFVAFFPWSGLLALLLAWAIERAIAGRPRLLGYLSLACALVGLFLGQAFAADASPDDDGYTEAANLLKKHNVACGEITGATRKGPLARLLDLDLFDNGKVPTASGQLIPGKNVGAIFVRCSNGRDYQLHRIELQDGSVQYRLLLRDTLTNGWNTWDTHQVDNDASRYRKP